MSASSCPPTPSARNTQDKPSETLCSQGCKSSVAAPPPTRARSQIKARSASNSLRHERRVASRHVRAVHFPAEHHHRPPVPSEEHGERATRATQDSTSQAQQPASHDVVLSNTAVGIRRPLRRYVAPHRATSGAQPLPSFERDPDTMSCIPSLRRRIRVGCEQSQRGQAQGRQACCTYTARQAVAFHAACHAA